MLKFFKLKIVLKYLYDQLTGNFLGFIIGMSATSVVSQFFETRSIRNLWGLSSKKTVVDKETFQNLEWIISIIIGFIVFEIVTKVVKERLPVLKVKFFRWVINNNVKAKASDLMDFLNNKRAVLFESFSTSLRNTFSKR